MINSELLSSESLTTSEKSVCEHCDGAETRELTMALVRIESHRNAPGHEANVATYIRDVFRQAGIEAGLWEVQPGRPNVIARLRGRHGGRRIIFNGHTDTVPPGQMVKPFEPRIESGLMYGRGTADMKAGLAAQICAMLALKRSAVELEGDVLFTGVIGEEDGSSLGTLAIVENEEPRAELVVVAEPTDLRLAVAHKGFDYYRIEVNGRAAHSSRPSEGVNAIYQAAAIVNAIENELVADLMVTRHPLLGSTTVNVASIIGYPESEAANAFGRGPLQKPDGGTVPDTCTMCLDQRRLPGSSHLDLVPRLQALIAGLYRSSDVPTPRVSFTPACPQLDSHPPLDTDPELPVVQTCLRIASAETGVAPEPVGVPYWSDAALFNSRWKVPAIVFGPGNINVAHSNNECVPVDQLLTATRINARIAASVVGSR